MGSVAPGGGMVVQVEGYMWMSVIGHGIGGKDIPIMARLAKGKTLE